MYTREEKQKKKKNKIEGKEAAVKMDEKKKLRGKEFIQQKEMSGRERAKKKKTIIERKMKRRKGDGFHPNPPLPHSLSLFEENNKIKEVKDAMMMFV